MFGTTGNRIYQIYPKRSGHAFVKRMVVSWFNYMDVVEIENISPANFPKFVPEKNEVVILQLRSLKNWIASYKKHSGKSVKRVGQNAKKWWLPVAKEFFGHTEYLKGYNVVRVYYDTFFKDRKYRQVICQQLGGRYNESKLNTVEKNGGGSSFSGLSYDGRAQQMGVLERYKGYERMIKDVINSDNELKQLCKKWGEL